MIRSFFYILLVLFIYIENTYGFELGDKVYARTNLNSKDLELATYIKKRNDCILLKDLRLETSQNLGRLEVKNLIRGTTTYTIEGETNINSEVFIKIVDNDVNNTLPRRTQKIGPFRTIKIQENCHEIELPYGSTFVYDVIKANDINKTFEKSSNINTKFNKGEKVYIARFQEKVLRQKNLKLPFPNNLIYREIKDIQFDCYETENPNFPNLIIHKEQLEGKFLFSKLTTPKKIKTGDPILISEVGIPNEWFEMKVKSISHNKVTLFGNVVTEDTEEDAYMQKVNLKDVRLLPVLLSQKEYNNLKSKSIITLLIDHPDTCAGNYYVSVKISSNKQLCYIDGILEANWANNIISESSLEKLLAN